MSFSVTCLHFEDGLFHDGNLSSFPKWCTHPTVLARCGFMCRPLHLAARGGMVMLVRELLAKGASILAVDQNGE